MSRDFQAPRGTLDWYGPRAALRRQVLDQARRVFESAAYVQAVTPTFEDTGVYRRTSGVGSDVVRKEMYSFQDKSGRDLTLRPEGTAGVMRAYLEHGLHHQPQPVKLWYELPMFRYNAVQKGRYREHYQFGAEAIGSEDPGLDAELIALQARWYRNVDVTGLTLLLNSIGDDVCRPGYIALLVAFLDEHIDELCEECRERRDTNPLRVFDCKNASCQAVLADAPKITDHLCDACREHFAAVRAQLDARGVGYQVEPRLVRGLDYYISTSAFRSPPAPARRAPLRHRAGCAWRAHRSIRRRRRDFCAAASARRLCSTSKSKLSTSIFMQSTLSIRCWSTKSSSL